LFYYAKLNEKSLAHSEALSEPAKTVEADLLADPTAEREIAEARFTAPVNKSYRAPGPRRLHLVDSYENGDTVWACEDKTSTSKKPVIYIETVESGVQSAYLVPVDEVDLSNMTKIEGYAIARYTGINVGADYEEMSEEGEDRVLDADKADYLDAVKKNISNYQRSIDSAVVSFARSIYESLEKPRPTTAVLNEFFL
jgi:hypothetical protein